MDGDWTSVGLGYKRAGSSELLQDNPHHIWTPHAKSHRYHVKVLRKVIGTVPFLARTVPENDPSL